MEYLLDESGRQQLVDLLPDGATLFLIESTQALLHRLGACLDVQGVLGDFSRYAGHVRGTPHKYVSVCAEKVDEHCFQFGVEARADPQRLAFKGLGVEEDELGFLRRLEAPGVTLGVGDVLVAITEAGEDRQRLGQSLGLLDALDVALVGVLARRADGDDAVRSRHLELEVRVFGHGHELGVAWSSQDRVVGPWECDHVEGEDLPSEVVRGPEADGQIDLPVGLGAMSRYHSVEWQSIIPQPRFADPHEGQSLSVKNVEAAASIHQHLSETSLGNDGVNDQWIALGVGNPIRVILPIERDRALGPLGVLGRGCADCTNFPEFTLPLTCGEARRASPKDQEAVLDLREALSLGSSSLGGSSTPSLTMMSV